jgi:peptidyl-prolyl cis-trans isomerase D
MLQSIRDRSQGWLTWFLVITICLSFALWGIHSYLQTGSTTQTIATVNGEIITAQQLQVSYGQLRQQAQADKQFVLTPSMQDVLKQQALGNLIETVVLRKAAEKAGYSISALQLDALIKQFPAFQKDGQFSAQRFQEVLGRIGYSPELFINSVKTDELINQVRIGFLATGLSLPNEVRTVHALLNQRRDIAYSILPLTKFKAEANPNSQQLLDYYGQHQADFIQAEAISLDYVELNLAKIIAEQKISEQQIAQYYQDNTALFTQPARYHLAHILLKRTADANQANNTEQKLAQLTSQLKKGDDFSALAKSFSDDVVTAQKGGDLGWVHLADLSPALQTAVAKMVQPGSVSQPFATPYGYEIIKLLDITPAKQQLLAQVTDNIKQRLAEQQAHERFAQLSDKLSSLSFSNPDSLAPVAKELRLPIQQTGLFTQDAAKSKATSLIQNAKVIAAAFSKDVKAGNNSDLIEIAPGQIIVLRIHQSKPASVLPFAQVKHTIADILQRQAMQEAAKKMGKEIIAKLGAGITQAELASQYGISWQTAEALSRHSESPQMAIVQASFQMAPPANKTQPMYQYIQLPSGDPVIIVLKNVINSQPAKVDAKTREAFAAEMAMSYANTAYQLYVQYQLSHAKIKKNLATSSEPSEEL